MNTQRTVMEAKDLPAGVAAMGLPAPWVVALPWGAMALAGQIAAVLHAPLDMLLTHDGHGQAAPDRSPVLLIGRTLVLVDDGSTGATALLAALQALRAMRPHGVVLVSPVQAHRIDAMLLAEIDHLVCLAVPVPVLPVLPVLPVPPGVMVSASRALALLA